MVLIWRHVVQCSMCVTWLLKQQNYRIKRKKGEGKGINQWVCQFAGFKLFTVRFWDVSASLSSLRSWRFIKRACKWTPKSSGEVARKIEPEVFHFFLQSFKLMIRFLRCKICQRNRSRYWLITWSFSLYCLVPARPCKRHASLKPTIPVTPFCSCEAPPFIGLW